MSDSPLRLKSFRRLFLVQIISDAGNWLDLLAVTSLVIYQWQMGPSAAAAVIVAAGIPWVLIGPVAAVWTDRFSPKLTMFASHALRIGVIGGMLIAPNLAVLLPLVAAKAALGALFDPARQSAVRLIVPDAMLAKAAALGQLSVNSTKVIAPIIGGVMVAAFGTKSPFILELCLFACSSLLLVFMKFAQAERHDSVARPSGGRPEPTDAKTASFAAKLKDGFAHIIRNRLLFIAVSMSGAGMFIVFLYDGLFSVWTEQAGYSEQTFGLFIGSVGAGSVIGSLALVAMTWWQKKPAVVMCAFGALSGCLIMIVGLGGSGLFAGAYWLWMLLFFLVGVSGSSFAVPFGYILQSETPAALMARTAAAANAVQTSAMLIAPVAGAALAHLIGVNGVLIAAGCLEIVMGALFAVPALRISRTTLQQAAVTTKHEGVANSYDL